jgi:hypothetical protein
MQDAPLTIFGGLRATDALLAFAAFFASYLLLQAVTTLRYLVLYLASITIGLAVYGLILGVRTRGPDGFHWSFLHWWGVLPIRGALPPRGVTTEPV